MAWRRNFFQATNTSRIRDSQRITHSTIPPECRHLLHLNPFLCYLPLATRREPHMCDHAHCQTALSLLQCLSVTLPSCTFLAACTYSQNPILQSFCTLSLPTLIILLISLVGNNNRFALSLCTVIPSVDERLSFESPRSSSTEVSLLPFLWSEDKLCSCHAAKYRLSLF